MRPPRRHAVIVASAALLGLTLLGPRVRAASEPVVTAVEANDVTALERLPQSAPTAQQRALAAGALLALRHEDAEAIARRRAGIRLLSRAASIGSTTERAVAVQLGIASRLQIGHAVLENVVFIVLPDSDWRIPRRLRIDVFLGLPVLMALGRLEFVNAGTPTLFYGGPRAEAAGTTGPRPNLLLSSLEPLVLVRVPGVSRPLRLQLDTGSDTTTLTRNAIGEAPALAAHAEPYVLRYADVGGVVTDRRALRLPEVALAIGGRRITLKNILVRSRASPTRDGVLGAEVLRQGVRWTLDFRTMTLAVAHPGGEGIDASRLRFGFISAISRVFIIVDTMHLQGVAKPQLADYIALLALARLRRGRVDDAPRDPTARNGRKAPRENPVRR